VNLGDHQVDLKGVCEEKTKQKHVLLFYPPPLVSRCGGAALVGEVWRLCRRTNKG